MHPLCLGFPPSVHRPKLPWPVLQVAPNACSVFEEILRIFGDS
jgi:hypothetical protein